MERNFVIITLCVRLLKQDISGTSVGFRNIFTEKLTARREHHEKRRFRLRCCPWWIAVSIRPFYVAYSWPLCARQRDVIHKTGSTQHVATPPEDRANRNESVPKIIINNTISLFLNSNQHFADSKTITVSECCLTASVRFI